MKKQIKNRIAFTIIELLTVVSIIAVFIAILIPAVHAARESGRRVACLNNLHQVSLACLNFEAGNSQLPTGLSGIGHGQKFVGMTWLTRILPHCEQSSVWSRAMDDYSTNPIPFRYHRGMQTSLSMYNCPSDPVAGEVHVTHEGYIVASTNYLGIAGVDHKSRDGVFAVDRAIRLAEIVDGLSNTLLIGERPPSNDFWFGWWYASGANSHSTGDVLLGVAEKKPAGISFMDNCFDGEYTFSRGNQSQCDTLHYWSYHSGGCNFSLVDGSSKFIGYQIDPGVLKELSTRSSGQIVGAVY